MSISFTYKAIQMRQSDSSRTLTAFAAKATRNRHPGKHRPGALVFEPGSRHPFVAVSRGRGDGVSVAGAGTRLDDRHVGRRPPVARERLDLPQLPRCEMDRREEARATAISQERLPRFTHAGPTGNGDLRSAWGKAEPDAGTRVLQGRARLPRRPRSARYFGRVDELIEIFSPVQPRVIDYDDLFVDLPEQIHRDRTPARFTPI
jgi:hypothetical protein